MMTRQFLVDATTDIAGRLGGLDTNRPCLVQLFTNDLSPQQAVDLALQVRHVLPLAKILGTSVSGIIYQGGQYDGCTLVVAEQYDTLSVDTHLVALEGKVHQVIAREVVNALADTTPGLLRLFVGGYYDYAHQLIGNINGLCPELKIVGGMAGELHQDTQTVPFVFDDTQALASGLAFATVSGETLSLYGRINTAHEPLGEVHTITESEGRAICAIDGESAQVWLQRNVGVLGTKAYETWEDIAQNDPLVRLQLALESHNCATRFLRYDEQTQEISQYFSRLPAGTKFRISYTSPSKCVEQCRETCLEVANTPIEQLFCYSCLFRRLYLKNCAQWELAPYHENPVSGVFLLGEFGYTTDQGNALLNGSCVLSGVAEQERYLTVDLSRLEQQEDIRGEDQRLMDFIMARQRQISSAENERILEDMVVHESRQQASPYQRMNIGVAVGDMNQYEQDKEYLRFNKICLVRVENADTLVSYAGQTGYFAQLKYLLESLNKDTANRQLVRKLHFYVIKSDTFLVGANQVVDREDFSTYITQFQRRCASIQGQREGIPFLLRFVMVRGEKFLLERAYAKLEQSRQSQLDIIEEGMTVGDNKKTRNEVFADEIACINLIQYALKHDKVIPYYQGIYNNETKEIDKYEALMRLYDDQGNVYGPYHFMDIAKKYRLYLELNLKMFHAVLRDFSALDCPVNINISAHDITSVRFRQELRQALTTFHKPSNLTFEILEDECVSDLKELQDFMEEIHSYGAQIAVDDFGSGYSNLLEIAKISPDIIKIDGQIIRGVGQNVENQSILEMVSLLGKRLAIGLVAEFVENDEIQSYVESHGIVHSQGYYFSIPQPFASVYDAEQARRGVCVTTKPQSQEV